MENELEQLGERIAEQAAHLGAATHRLLADLRAFDAHGGWHAQGAASCAHWLPWLTEDGMVKIEAVLHPEEAEMVWAMLDHAAAQLAREPRSPSGRDSAESGAASRLHETFAGPLPAPAMRDSADAAACSSPTDDSAESLEPASPAARWDVGLDGSARSVLDRLLDEADALCGVDVAADDAMSDLRDPECELGVAGAVQCPPEAASGRREVGSLRDRAAAARTAFNRADGLVAMAQGYLRGNRPERAPIEVVLCPRVRICDRARAGSEAAIP